MGILNSSQGSRENIGWGVCLGKNVSRMTFGNIQLGPLRARWGKMSAQIQIRYGEESAAVPQKVAQANGKGDSKSSHESGFKKNRFVGQ